MGKRIWEWIKKEVTKQLKKKNRQTWEEDGIIYIDSKIYVPKNRQLRDEILSDNHNPLDIRHPVSWLGKMAKLFSIFIFIFYFFYLVELL